MNDFRKALKNLVTECYKGKYQHGNSELKNALESAETLLVNSKNKEVSRVKISVYAFEGRKLLDIGFAPLLSDMHSNHIQINLEKERIAKEHGYSVDDCYFFTDFV